MACRLNNGLQQINLKSHIMKIQTSNTATESRKHSFFSKFKDSKRIAWSQRRNYSF